MWNVRIVIQGGNGYNFFNKLGVSVLTVRRRGLGGLDLKTQVAIIGGGITGVGIARDLAQRGIDFLLIEKGDLANGASGRNHGYLHSGARYVVNDPHAAGECIRENQILKQIASWCVEDTGGLFVSLPEDCKAFRDQFLSSCEEIGIPTRSLAPSEALELEPNLSHDISGAIYVPDAAIDPFSLVFANAEETGGHGNKILARTEVTHLIQGKNGVKGVEALNLETGQPLTVHADFVVNAAGAWADQIARLADLSIELELSKGSMVVCNRRLSHRVIHRCRPPSDGDIVVPNHTVSVLGTTSVKTGNMNSPAVEPWEVSFLIEETSKMLPCLLEARYIRAYAGVRPLLKSGSGQGSRKLSRGFVLLDHARRDGVKNFITITGGKLITYRLMAEKTVDLICEKMELDVPCKTHVTPLSEPKGRATGRGGYLGRLGKEADKRDAEIICDCEFITRGELEEALEGLSIKGLRETLHRTRLAKGTCQGAFCSYRLLGMLHDMDVVEKINLNAQLRGFLEERWRGIRPVLWGEQLREHQLIEEIYLGILNLDKAK
jgi:glycerol-3-phosphate dehydrogenase